MKKLIIVFLALFSLILSILLMFFLFVTHTNSSSDLEVFLPKKLQEDEIQPPVLPKRNNFLVHLMNNKVMVTLGDKEGEEVDVSELKGLAKTFITNRDNLEMYPALEKDIIEYVDNVNTVHTLPASDFEGPGEMMVAKKHVISLQTDRATQYQLYFDVQAQLYEAYTELRDSLSKARYGVPFEKLDENQQMVCRLAYPIMISEAEPGVYVK